MGPSGVLLVNQFLALMTRLHAAGLWYVLNPITGAQSHHVSLFQSHGDLKRDNLLLHRASGVDDNELRLADFGLSGFFQGNSSSENLPSTKFFVYQGRWQQSENLVALI